MKPSPAPDLRRLPIRFYVQVVICALLWGSAFPVIKNSFAGLQIDTYGEQLVFAGSRFFIAGLLLVLPFCRGSVIAKLRLAPRWQLVPIVLGQTYFRYLR